MDIGFDDETDSVELLVVIEDENEESLYEGTFTLGCRAVEIWESIDLEDPDKGLALLRTLVLSKLDVQEDPLKDLILEALYTQDVTPRELINEGITDCLCEAFPKLSLVRSVVEKVYETMSSAVIELGFRKVH